MPELKADQHFRFIEEGKRVRHVLPEYNLHQDLFYESYGVIHTAEKEGHKFIRGTVHRTPYYDGSSWRYDLHEAGVIHVDLPCIDARDDNTPLSWDWMGHGVKATLRTNPEAKITLSCAVQKFGQCYGVGVENFLWPELADDIRPAGWRPITDAMRLTLIEKELQGFDQMTLAELRTAAALVMNIIQSDP